MYIPSKQMNADMPRYEGKSLSVYADSLGNATQGIGQHDGVHFGDPDITEEQMYANLAGRLQVAYSDALGFFPALDTFDLVRKETLIQLAFNLGANTLAQFVPFIAHINAQEWDEAAYHLQINMAHHITSYEMQVGARAVETALRICSGNILKEFIHG
jgi:GH24 family phage-related lysozyme (muramidase)